ncbi:protein A5 [Aotine betaherpesvirus 1]|uniref:Protein A5 n=1 Tax=Aotine betaherpesvirus 1 TaxID=50290 RepID=G8XU78_9BETA|nr:protein A5 [Aotine betaherpesvirus 1]AEV80815.1 protein A5 [Aotine betaherpesvirus 1]
MILFNTMIPSSKPAVKPQAEQSTPSEPPPYSEKRDARRNIDDEVQALFLQMAVGIHFLPVFLQLCLFIVIVMTTRQSNQLVLIGGALLGFTVVASACSLIYFVKRVRPTNQQHNDTP